MKKIKSKIPLSLPLLDYINKKYSYAKSKSLKNFKVLAVQHLLGSTVPFFSMLEKSGVSPENIFIVGKAYSSHPLIVNELIKKNYNLNFEDVFKYKNEKPYDSVLEENINKYCKLFLDSLGNNQKGLIVDDGGKAIKFMHKKYPNRLSNISCIEQTSRGARVINKLNLKCPVVNVARSNAKTIYESPSIGKAMVREFLVLLKDWEKLEIFKTPYNKVLLIGFGFIGENVADELKKRKFSVSVFDNNKDQLKKAKLKKFNVITNRRNVFKEARIIIGCTGNPVLEKEELSLLKNETLLVNMASTDIEFPSWILREKGKIVHQNILQSDKKYLLNFMPLPWRSLYKKTVNSKSVYLVNGGFPTDFSGKINPVPIEDIQLTSALLFGGIIQASRTNNCKFVELDLEFQKSVLDKYRKLKS